MTMLKQAATLAAATIALAAAAAAPSLADGDSGPDTCINGFVWRDAGPADHVCVSPATRTQAAADNAQAAARRDSDGACLTGFVTRDASRTITSASCRPPARRRRPTTPPRRAVACPCGS